MSSLTSKMNLAANVLQVAVNAKAEIGEVAPLAYRSREWRACLQTGEVFSGSFAVADASERRPLRFADRLVDSVNHPLILLLPGQVVFPGAFSKDPFRLVNFRSMP